RGCRGGRSVSDYYDPTTSARVAALFGQPAEETIDPATIIAALLGSGDSLSDAQKRLNLAQDVASVQPSYSKKDITEQYPDFQPTPSAAKVRYTDPLSAAAISDVDDGAKSAADVESLFFDNDGNLKAQTPDGSPLLLNGQPITKAQAQRAVQAAN